ncbi:septin 4 [Paragonimus westermani]|uniref:Septin 4 n=1 Tax=Paragonimus westermani TaxID=34504 RepID=A0A5J4N8K4_9TREM|nr:septin 4 [Paragonimus westermani]
MGDHSSLFSFSSHNSRASTSQETRERRHNRKLPKRFVDALQRWTGVRPIGGYPNSSRRSSTASESSDTNLSCAVSEVSESLVSSVIRDRKQFTAQLRTEITDTLGPTGGSCPPKTLLPVQPLSGVVQRYITALELSELEHRSDAGGPFVHRPVPYVPRKYEVNTLSSGRERSFRDPTRRMRPVPITVGLRHTRWRQTDMTSEEDSRLGFGNLPDQMHRKAVKKGFNFTLMVVGESGLGKSTLINSLFMQDLYKDREIPDAADRIQRTTVIEKRQIELDERGVKLRLTVVDTPGFNDAVDSTNCAHLHLFADRCVILSWKPIEDYIDGTFEQYFKDECGLNRKNIHDNRVHCCLYFISPYGHGLRQVDVEFIRRLQHKVNIVPIIAKADALTAPELRAFKERIMSDFDRYKIDIYRLPECDSDEEEEIKRLDKEIKSVLPFAVIGSNCVIDVEGGRRVRGRQYPWGVVEVENARHCDFTKLRIFLLKTHMQDLKDMTLDVHYENYRAKYITERMSKRQTDRREVVGGGPRSDRDTGSGFETLVDPDSLLRQKEEELQRMQQMVNRMQEQMKRGAVVVGNANPVPSVNAPLVPTGTNNL